MKHSPVLPIAAICLTAMLVSSCACWNIGTALRESATVNTGVDVRHPVDGKLYRVGKGDSARYYMQAPEVEYTPRHRYAYMWGDIYDIKHDIEPGEEVIAADIKPTGRMCWVEVGRNVWKRDAFSNVSEWGFVKEVAALPAGAKLVRTGETFDDTPLAADFGTLSTRQTAWSGVKNVLSYPAKYVADPVMDVVCNAGLAVVYTACVPVGLVTVPLAQPLVSRVAWPDREACDKIDALYKKTTRIGAQKHGTSFLFVVYPKSILLSGSPREYSAIELAEVADKRKPYCLSIDSGMTDAECGRAVAELQAQGFNITAMVKDWKVVPLPAKKMTRQNGRGVLE